MQEVINRALFYKVCCDATIQTHERYNIGTYKEKKLHVILKHYFEPDNDYHEVPYEGYIADIKRESSITEIETSGFSGLNDKLAAFLPSCRVRLVYPIPQIRYLSWIDPETGDISKKRRSPKKHDAYDVLFEMIRIRPHITDPNLTVTAVMLNVDEYRMLNGWSRDKKKGSARYERIPTDILEVVSFSQNDDYLPYLPIECRPTFTVPQFAKAAKIDAHKAQAIVKVFAERGIVRRTGEKKGNAYIYTTESGAR